ncbi:SIMPL domain-containing protein [Nostoc sp.]|uniref:SIMPL domain-containing protein n=1 Tax=Nostoc sp. TaxID=1180 RepID=UPI002FF611A0
MAKTNNPIVVSGQAHAIVDPLTGSTNANTAQILNVTGQGEVTVPTTLTEVQLGVQVQGKTATEVQQQTAQRSTAVVDVLQKLGAQELQTTSIQLNPVYNDTQTLTGFTGLNTLQFELPTARAGAAIDTAIQAGANLIQNISFTASDQALQQARLQVLSEAVKDAQAQAQAVFSTLNLTPGKIIDININSADNPSPSPLVFNATQNAARIATTPIIGSPQTIEGSVSLDIGYSPNSAATLASATHNLTGASKPAFAIVDPLTGSTNANTAQILNVTGQGEVTVPTTLTEVQLGIQVNGKTATEVQEKTAQRSTAVVDVLQKLGAQELQTTSIQLNPVYNDSQILTGFTELNTLQFELPTARAGAAIDTAIQAGANLIQNISFTASDQALQQARLQVLSEAVIDAQTQAQTVFSTLKLTPGKIIDIDINSADNSSPSPLVFNVADKAFATGTRTPLIGGTQTIEGSVSLDIAYSPNSAGTLDLAVNGLQRSA